MRRFRVCRTRELVQGGTRFAQDILACKCIKPASQLQDCLAHSRLCTHGVGMSEVWDSSFRCSHQACRIILHLCDDSAQEVLFPLCHHLFSKSRCRGQTQTPHLSIFLANPGGPRARWPLLFPTPPLCKRFRLLSGQFLESYAEASLPARLSAQARRHPAGPRAWSWGATNSASLDLERVQGQVLGWNLALYHFPSPHHKESAWKVHSLGQRLRTLEGRLKTPRRGDQRFYPVYQLHGWTSWSSRSRPPCLVTGSWDHTPPPPPHLVSGPEERLPTRSHHARAALGASKFVPLAHARPFSPCTHAERSPLAIPGASPVAQLAPNAPQSSSWLISEMPRNKEKAPTLHSVAAGTPGLRARTGIPAPALKWSGAPTATRQVVPEVGTQAAALRAAPLTFPLASNSMM